MSIVKQLQGSECYKSLILPINIIDFQVAQITDRQKSHVNDTIINAHA